MKSRPTGALSVERWQPIGLLMVPKVGNLPWRHATLPVLTALAIGFIPRYDWCLAPGDMQEVRHVSKYQRVSPFFQFVEEDIRQLLGTWHQKAGTTKFLPAFRLVSPDSLHLLSIVPTAPLFVYFLFSRLEIAHLFQSHSHNKHSHFSTEPPGFLVETSITTFPWSLLQHFFDLADIASYALS
ncbi:hypothetical protein V2G26_015950 [Clonostachys chloroleuca]